MGGVNDLVSAVRAAVHRLRKQNNRKGVQLARMIGTTSVRIFGRIYPATLAVDVTVKDGDYVYVLISDSGQAVVVGK